MNLEALLENLTHSQLLPGLQFQHPTEWNILIPKDIISIEADRSYSWFYLNDKPQNTGFTTS
ncbi:MAG: hypothetical protein MZV63_10935 [Marinilabiliales bacterium]|nr:hypothetical protein [Marinilabiliales bacterium]